MHITKEKKLICKGQILYDPNDRKLWKGKTYETMKRSNKISDF